MHKFSVNTGFAKQIIPILCILCYNGSLVTRTVVSLITAKFKPFIFLEISQSQSHIATDGQSVSFGVKPNLGPMTRYLLLFDSYGLVIVGHPL
jgi:hypothetical protein